MTPSQRHSLEATVGRLRTRAVRAYVVSKGLAGPLESHHKAVANLNRAKAELRIELDGIQRHAAERDALLAEAVELLSAEITTPEARAWVISRYDSLEK